MTKSLKKSMIAGTISIVLAVSNLGCSGSTDGAEIANSSAPKTPATIREIFLSEDPNVDQRLQAILENPDDIVAVLVEGENGWLADAMADTVKMAPFDERRRAGFDALLNIARRALKEPAAKSSPEKVINMPPRSIYLTDDRFRVVPSYGDGAVLDLMREFQGDPRYEVRRLCTSVAGVLSNTVRDHAAVCDEFLKRQLKIEKEMGVKEAIEDDKLAYRLRHIESWLEVTDSVLNHAWEPASIPDTAYRTLQLASREELMERAAGGYWVALNMLHDDSPDHEEREYLLKAVSECQSKDPFKAASILQTLCYPVRPEEPRDRELARVEQLLDWFERELDPSILQGIPQSEYIKCLHSLAGWPMTTKDPLESPKYLDPDRGLRVIALLEQFKDNPDGIVLANHYMELLRRIYK